MGKALKTLLGLLVLLVVIWAVYQLSSTRPAKEETRLGSVKIGLIESRLDEATATINQAVDMALSSDALTSNNAELVREDVACDLGAFQQALDRLASDEGLVFLLDVSCPNLEGKSFVAATTSGLPVLTLFPVASDASSGFVFSAVPSAASQNAFAARLARELGDERMVILSSSFQEDLIGAFPELGGHVVGAETIETDAEDVRGDLATFEGTNPDVLVLSVDEAETFVAALAQVAETDLLPIDILASKHLLPAEGLDEEAVRLETLFLFDLTLGTASFKTSFSTATGNEPGRYAVHAFDAVQVLSRVLADQKNRSEGASRNAVAEFLKQVSFEGESGTIVFDEQGGVEGRYDIFFFEDGKLVQTSIRQVGPQTVSEDAE